MTKYIALLRGINVSGQKKIKMVDLKKLLSKSSLKNIQTYIQSGNIIFESENKNQQELAQEISTLIYKEYNFEVPVMIKCIDEWEKILNNNPFLQDKTIDIKQLSVTFLDETPSNENIDLINKIDFSPDTFILNDTVIYSCYPNGIGRSKMTNNMFEKKLKTIATSRNWNTVNKLYSLSK